MALSATETNQDAKTINAGRNKGRPALLFFEALATEHVMPVSIRTCASVLQNGACFPAG
jgi:hypothetical protein